MAESKRDRQSSTATGELQLAPVSRTKIILIVLILVTVSIGPIIVFIVARTGDQQVSCALHVHKGHCVPILNMVYTYIV